MSPDKKISPIEQRRREAALRGWEHYQNSDEGKLNSLFLREIERLHDSWESWGLRWALSLSARLKEIHPTLKMSREELVKSVISHMLIKK